MDFCRYNCAEFRGVLGLCVLDFWAVSDLKIITLHEQFSRYGRNAREWMRKCVLLLPEIERNRVWEKKGFGSIYEYAAKLAGMSRETVNDSLRILKRIEGKPELMRVVEEKGINCIKPIVNLVNDSESEKFWADKAMQMSKNTLETYIHEYKAQGFLDEYSHKHLRDVQNAPLRLGKGMFCLDETMSIKQKRIVAMELESEIAEQLEKLKAQNDWNTLMKEFLKLREEKLAAELKEIEQKEIKKTLKNNEILNKNTEIAVSENQLCKAKSRPAPAKIKKYVLRKTNHTCAFPGCTKPAENLHHSERFSITGRHDPEKIIPLCKTHHELAHDGLIENEDESVENWKIRREADQTDYKSVIDQQVMAHKAGVRK